MGRPYGDDLRRKFLSAYDQGEDSLSQLAARFLVSASWAKKISAQRRRTGHAERVPHKPGRKPHADARAQQQVIGWVAAEPDLTLVEIQAKLDREAGVILSRGRVWFLLKKLGLRLKKSHSTPSSATQKPIESGAKSLSQRSARYRRNA
jgi:transposase